MGNRIAKHILASDSTWERSTYYNRDAQGNVMSVYEYTYDDVAEEVSYKMNEQHIYGSSRVGMRTDTLEMIAAVVDTSYYERTLGKKQYEFSNHLGNVLSVISDKKLPKDWDSDDTVDSYHAELFMSCDYSPFGVTLSGRDFTSESYRYGFNGMEKDDEVKGSGNSYDFGARIYDNRLGRWLSVDAEFKNYPSESYYLALRNNPIFSIDFDGNSGVAYKDEKTKTVTIKSTIYFYGSKASKTQAKANAKNIEDNWNAAGGKVMIDGVEYDVKFEVNGLYATEDQAMTLAATNDSPENNFIRVVDDSKWDSKKNPLKSSAYGMVTSSDGSVEGSNAGIFIDKEITPGKTTDVHEYGHGLGWFESGECDGGVHDCSIVNGVPGIMSARGTPVADKYGYSNQPSGQRTVDPSKRTVLQSDITKIDINTVLLDWLGVANVGKATNTIYGEDGVVKQNTSPAVNSSGLVKAVIHAATKAEVENANK